MIEDGETVVGDGERAAQRLPIFKPTSKGRPVYRFALFRFFVEIGGAMENASSTMAAGALPAAEANRESRAQAVPWHCWAVVLGATCIPIGALWDISWHSTIGRDTFWTPAHICIHLGGLVPGFTAGWLALRATWFGTPAEREAAVGLGPFRAPLGAWVILWGAFSMLLSAPLDDWWHNAYGLDVEILSPPHTVLAAGMYAVAIGSLLLVLAFQNRASAEQNRANTRQNHASTGENGAGSGLFIWAAGVLVTMSTIIVTELSHANLQHGSTFYIISAAIYPMYLVAAARASKRRWAATGAAAVYMLIYIGMIQVLPLFAAQPLLAPIYNPVERMVPPGFPLLLVVPGLAIDLAMRAWRWPQTFWKDCALAAVLGAVFLGAFVAAQYPFASFLLSPAADNAFFAGNRWWPYFVKLGDFQHRFWDLNKDPLTAAGLLTALGLAVFKARISLAVGGWMSRVRR